jgi:hypothetical protein
MRSKGPCGFETPELRAVPAHSRLTDDAGASLVATGLVRLVSIETEKQ